MLSVESHVDGEVITKHLEIVSDFKSEINKYICYYGETVNGDKDPGRTLEYTTTVKCSHNNKYNCINAYKGISNVFIEWSFECTILVNLSRLPISKYYFITSKYKYILIVYTFNIIIHILLILYKINFQHRD